MKFLILLTIFISANAFAQDYEREQFTRIYLMSGIANVDKDSQGDKKTSEDIYTIGTSFRVSDFAHIGMYYSTNDHYGWIVGFDLDDTSRLRVMVGNTKMTDQPQEQADPFAPYQEPDDKVYTFGAGYDYQFSHTVGVSVQGFSYDSGNDSHNYEVSAGLTFSF